MQYHGCIHYSFANPLFSVWCELLVSSIWGGSMPKCWLGGFLRNRTMRDMWRSRVDMSYDHMIILAYKFKCVCFWIAVKLFMCDKGWPPHMVVWDLATKALRHPKTLGILPDCLCCCLCHLFCGNGCDVMSDRLGSWEQSRTCYKTLGAIMLNLWMMNAYASKNHTHIYIYLLLYHYTWQNLWAGQLRHRRQQQDGGHAVAPAFRRGAPTPVVTLVLQQVQGFLVGMLSSKTQQTKPRFWKNHLFLDHSHLQDFISACSCCMSSSQHSISPSRIWLCYILEPCQQLAMSVHCNLVSGWAACKWLYYSCLACRP